jgi:hypothetical protein
MREYKNEGVKRVLKKKIKKRDKKGVKPLYVRV